MAQEVVSTLLYLLDAAFEGPDWHALLVNLGAVTPEDWTWRPPGGTRTIRDIVQHVGGCKLMYENHAFGDGRLTWEDPLVDGVGALATVPEAVAWLHDCQARLRTSVAVLDDADLDQPRMTNWGEPKPTRWITTAMIQHDLYHAGEINHLRSLHGHDDRWAYLQAETR